MAAGGVTAGIDARNEEVLFGKSLVGLGQLDVGEAGGGTGFIDDPGSHVGLAHSDDFGGNQLMRRAL